MRLNSKNTLFLSLLFLIPFTLACGYHLMGKGGQFPGGVTALAISPLENRTLEPNLGTIFTSALQKEFILRRELKIVRAQEAEAILKGTINSLTTSSIAYDEEGRAREYRITVTLDILLMRRAGSEVLWRGDGIKGSQDYKASSDVMVNEGRKTQAIRRIAADLAEEVYFRIKEGF